MISVRSVASSARIKSMMKASSTSQSSSFLEYFTVKAPESVNLTFFTLLSHKNRLYLAMLVLISSTSKILVKLRQLYFNQTKLMRMNKSKLLKRIVNGVNFSKQHLSNRANSDWVKKTLLTLDPFKGREVRPFKWRILLTCVKKKISYMVKWVTIVTQQDQRLTDNHSSINQLHSRKTQHT